MCLKFSALLGCQLWEKGLSVTNPVYFVPVCGGENLAWHQVPLNRCFSKQRQKKWPPPMLSSSSLLVSCLTSILNPSRLSDIVKSMVCIWPCCHGFSSCMGQDMCLLYILWDAEKREGGLECWCPLVPHSSVCETLCVFNARQLSPLLMEMLRAGGHMKGWSSQLRL